MHSIICAVDGSQVSRAAAQVAARLAHALGLRLVLAHASDVPPSFPYGDSRLGELRRRRALEEGRLMLEDVADELPPVPVEARVVFGGPVEGLTAVGREEAAELLVVGSRGRGPLAAAVLGSVSARLAATAEWPVVVVPSPEAAERFELGDGTIVVGVDGSGESGRAAQVAADLAERAGLELRPLYVDRRDPWQQEPVDDDAGYDLELADPVEGISRRAEEADATLIAVGSRGRGTLRAAVLGSVSGTLAATAPLPVLVVPPTVEVAESSAVRDLLARVQRRRGESTAVVDAGATGSPFR